MSEYLGVDVRIASNDPEHLEFLQAAGEGRLVLQHCSACRHLRYPVGNACPFCTSLEWEWSEVSGKGTIYSYGQVMHPIHPAYREHGPYAIVLVELDEQREYPTPDDGLRLISSLVDGDGNPEPEERVAIGARVEVDFANLGDGLGLPRFRLSGEEANSEVWSFPN